jgi:hypothetical protein
MGEVAAHAARHKPLHVAQFLQRHAAFLRRARDTAHQALFFVGLLSNVVGRRSAQRAVELYRPFGLEQVKTLVRGVHLPDRYERAAEVLKAGDLDADPEERRQVERAVDAYQRWCGIFDQLGDPERVDVEKLRQDLFDFLDQSSAERWLDRCQLQWLQSFLLFLRKHLAVFWAALLALAVIWKIEAVHSLLWNEGWRVLLPSALLALPMALPLLVAVRVRSKYPGTVPFWDIGGSSFRRIRYQALEPGRLIRRFDRRLRPSLPREIIAGQGMRLAFLALVWVIALAIVCGRQVWFGASNTSVTLFLVLSHLYALLILSRIIDFWEFLDTRPIRFGLLLAATVVLLSLLAGLGREFFIGAFTVAALAQALFPRVRPRRRIAWGLGLLLPVVILVSGRHTLEKEAWKDGTRKWQRLEPGQWPWPAQTGEPEPPVVVVAASGGGSRAAVYAGLFFERLEKEHPEIARELQAVSSVSGGSLATAAYLTRRLERTSQDKEFGEADGEARARAVSGLPEALSEDFIFPTLKGALMPGQTRSSAIEEAWREGPVHLGSYHLSDLAQEWQRARARGATHPPFPIPLFNTATLDGHDLVVSPFARSLYTRPDLDEAARDLKSNPYRREASGRSTWVYYRDGTYALEDLLPRFDPLLSSAVRASANFPFGFPLVRIQTREPLFFSPVDRKGEKRVYLTDGGALSNSGMWSLFNLLMRPEVVKELRRRGVLLLIVDANKMPSFRRLDLAFNSLVGTIEDQCPVGQRLHREMFDLLGTAYGDRIAVVQLDLVAQESYNVLTTWALDNASLKTLKKSFNQRWGEEEANLIASWNALRAGRPGPACPPPGQARIPTLRPPLD